MIKNSLTKKAVLTVSSLLLASTMAITASASELKIDFEDGSTEGFSAETNQLTFEIVEDDFAGDGGSKALKVDAQPHAQWGGLGYCDTLLLEFPEGAKLTVPEGKKIVFQIKNLGPAPLNEFYARVRKSPDPEVQTTFPSVGVNETREFSFDNYTASGPTDIDFLCFFDFMNNPTGEVSFLLDNIRFEDESYTLKANGVDVNEVAEDDDADAEEDTDATVEDEETDADDADKDDEDEDVATDVKDVDTTTVPKSGNASVATVAAIVLAGATATLVATKKQK